MILSKGNLQVVQVAKDDKDIIGLNNVHITKEGATVAVNRDVVVIVSPVDERIKKRPVMRNMSTPVDEAFTISAETIKEVVKNIPRDVQFGGELEYCDVDKDGVFTITDGKREKKITGKKSDRKFVDYEEQIASTGSVVFETALNYKRLHTVLDTISKIAPDVSGESVVLLQFTDKGRAIIRSKNMRNNQEVYVIISTYSKIAKTSVKKLLGVTSTKTRKNRK